LVAHLRDTDELLRNLNTGRASEETWRKIEAALPHHLPFESQITGWKRIAAVIVFGLISGLLGAVTYGKINHNGLGIHPDDFTKVSINQMASTDEPHVVTEGYVSEVRLEQDDGDTVFKIVQDLKQPGPFVICEVIDPLKMPTPPVGSRVRVYGVSRYDGKTNHEWHEVHPVLDIEVLKK